MHTNLSVFERERQCIDLANTILRRRMDIHTFRSYVYRSVIEPLGDPLAWILLPLVLLLLPYSVYEAFVAYKQHRAHWEELIARARDHVAPHHDMAALWDRFGLPAIDFLTQEDVLAECLSGWIAILYGGSYSLSTSEIIQVFNEESKRQGRVMNEGYERGLKLNLANWRIGAVRKIVENAPPY